MKGTDIWTVNAQLFSNTMLEVKVLNPIGRGFFGLNIFSIPQGIKYFRAGNSIEQCKVMVLWQRNKCGSAHNNTTLKSLVSLEA